jgi:dTDP-4-dehydrorhamnose reductase
MEIWGGVECTVNRVGDRFRSQMSESGHDCRIEDLDRFAALGLRTLRYPVLWELTAPDAPDVYRWDWADDRLRRLRDLRIDPIVGLLHHGSGPQYTHLLDDGFADCFASYALAVARRYPWIGRYTPVNEPLTTARFSALYGHWYPHHRDDRSFIRAVLNQCRATVLAMHAIRSVNPAAQLVQTDDLGHTTSTANLAYQADFDNERRWLSWDLLCGRIDRCHPLWSYLRGNGATEEELAWFRERATPPDIIGINHYVTSDRHLDDRIELYPPSMAGGNGRDRYVDVETVRVPDMPCAGIDGAMEAGWARYQLPLAITEAHIGCTRDEQLRWLNDVWTAANAAQSRGIDVRAVTAWALLGSFDWDSLLTQFRGHYEPGVFDVRSVPPRATGLAPLIRDLSVMDGNGDTRAHTALLNEPGWWRRSTRYLRELSSGTNQETPPLGNAHAQRQPLLIAGAGTLGRAFARLCEARGLTYALCGRAELDICDAQALASALERLRPRAVVNTAGYVRVDDAERERSKCYRENTCGAGILARACAERDIPLLTYSSDLVFDGNRSTPYLESDDVAPMNVYGSSKAHAERVVERTHPDALIIRTSAFFGPWDQANFLFTTLRALVAGKRVAALNDVVVSPTYVPDLVHASLDLLIDGESGIWHLANVGAVTWSELARRAAQLARIDASPLIETSRHAPPCLARRPAFSALCSQRGHVMPSLDDALERYIRAVDLH